MMRPLVLGSLLLAACGAAPRSDDAGATLDIADAGPADAGVDGGIDAGSPQFVRFLSPADGGTVSNPVVFTIAAAGVDEVQLFADQTYALGPAWDPATRDTLRYRFAGTGFPRPISLVGRVAGQEVARAELTITVTPDTCEERFFVSEFDRRNVDPSGTVDLRALREDSLAALEAEVAELRACGATVTLGGLMSLLLYEGAFRVAAFNTRCLENSYNRTTSDCDLVAEALYSYQFGIGAIHTSNFHPCKGGAYTQSMRSLLLERMNAAGFATDAGLLTQPLVDRFHTVCPTATPNAVDYYLLGAHELFGVPKNTSGNHLAGYGRFPLFTPAVSIAMSFHELALSCANIHGDRDAIRIFGGADTSYASTTKQDQILSAYESYRTANCP